MLTSGHGVTADQFEPGIAADQQARSHSTRAVFTDTTLDLALGLHPRVAAELSVPVRLVGQSTEFFGGSGEKLAGFDSIHHHNGIDVGPGDPTLGGRLHLLDADGLLPMLDVRVNTSLPLGGTRPDPTALGAAGLSHEHIFFGSGTFDPGAGLDAVWPAGPVRVLAFGQGRFPLYANRHGYRAGSRVAAGLGVDFAAGVENVRWIVRPEFYREGVSGWGDHPAEMSGRTDLIATVGMTWQPAPGWAVVAMAKRPLYTWTVDGDIELPFVATLGVVRDWRVWGGP